MKTVILLASMIILLSMEVRAARFSDDDNLFDVLADDAISSNSNNKKNNSINGIRNSNKNNSNNGIRNNNKNNSDRNDLDNSSDIGNVFTNGNDNGNGSSDADESMTDTSGGLSFNSLFSNVGTTIFTVTGVSILATLLLMLLMGYDFGSLLGRLDNNFGASSFIAPNYPYDEGLDNYPPPVILARRSYAALTPVIEAITSAYKKYQGKY